jgi:imidazolonepropionase-like amidohydrolase
LARHGTTTVEAKSGYGLNLESEVKSLEAIRAAAREWPGTVVPTFLGHMWFRLNIADVRRNMLTWSATK